MPNAEELDAGLGVLRDAVRSHIRPHATRASRQYAEARRWGAFQVLVKLGFGDAALETIREAYEEMKMEYRPQEGISLGFQVTEQT